MGGNAFGFPPSVFFDCKKLPQQKTGTGRLAQLSLVNSEIVIGLDFTHNKRVNEIIENPDYEMRPDEEALLTSSRAKSTISEFIKPLTKKFTIIGHRLKEENQNYYSIKTFINKIGLEGNTIHLTLLNILINSFNRRVKDVDLEYDSNNNSSLIVTRKNSF